jgi:hypothetical protein
MKIGFFGDSYIDTVWHRRQNPNIPPGRKIWAHRLLDDLAAPFICSGLGGTSQYYAIAEWKRWSSKINFDVAIFTFTWPHRLYTDNLTERVITAKIEGRDLGELAAKEAEIQDAADKYYRYLYSKDEHEFEFELMIKWCLELPDQYPNTKFIFLPNTTSSQELAKKYFSRGTLVDFAFETLSLGEGERVGVAPYIMDRTGHLSDGVHEQVKDLIKDIVVNNKQGVIPVDYSQFSLVNLFPGYYD